MQRDAAQADVKPLRRPSALLDSTARIDDGSSTLTVKQLALASLEATLGPIKHAVTSPAVRKAAFSSAILAVIVALSVGSAIFAYLVFYYLYVPRVGFTQEIWLQYGQGQTPFAMLDMKRASLASDLVYDVVLDVVAPTSPRNIELGNFMVDLTLQAADGSTVMRSSRAASLAWTPPLVRFLKAILRLPAFLLFDFYSHSQTIRVPILTKKLLRTFSTPRITKALVQIGRPGLDGSAPGELQIYSATLRFTAHLTGLRWLMYYHRIISFFLFCGIFFTISLLTALVLWAASGYIWAREEDNQLTDTMADLRTANTEDTSDVKSIPSFPQPSYRRASGENSTRSELEDQARRLALSRNQDAALFSVETDTEGEDDLNSVLRHLQFGAATSRPESEDDGMIIGDNGGANTTSESSSPNWRDVSFSSNETLTRGVKKEEAEEPTIAGHMSVKTEGQESSASARSAREQSIRRRTSNRSMKGHSAE